MSGVLHGVLAATKTSGIVTTGLVVHLDAGNSSSYSGTGSTWTNLAGGSNATLTSATYSSTSGGGSFAFDGSTSYALITRPVEDDFTLSCWFSTSSGAGTVGSWWQGVSLIDGEVPSFVADYGTSMGEGKVMFGTGQPDTTITSPSTYNNGSWHHMTATRTKSSGALALYMNGSSVATGTGGTDSLTAPENLGIGGGVEGVTYFAGSIAVVMIYNVALTSTQVAQNYNAQRSRFGV